MPENKPDGWDDDWDKNTLSKNTRVRTVWNWGYTNGVIDYYDKSKFYIEGNKLKKYTGNEREISIPDGVYRVAEHTFSDCKEIDKLTIPASVEEFDDDLRWGRTKVKAVYFLGSQQKWKKVHFESDIYHIAEEIYVNGKRIK